MKLLGILAALFLTSLHAANWPQFRGPNGLGVADPKADPPIEFSSSTNLLWKNAVPSGNSSPCVWGNRIFLTAFDSGALKTICQDRKTGAILWEQKAEATEIERYYEPDGSPASSTVATDGKIVVSYFGSCGLQAYDFNGKLKWRRKMPVADTAGFGTGASPIISDGLVILNRDQKTDSRLLALDVRSGKTVWEAPRSEFMMGYSTPAVWKHDGKAEVVLPGFMRLKSYELKTGKELWFVPGMPAAVCSSPVFGDGLIYVSAWSNGSSENPLPHFEEMAPRMDSNKDKFLDTEELTRAGMKAFLEFADSDKDKRISADEWEATRATGVKGKNMMIAVRPGGSGDITQTHVAWEQTKGLPYVPSPLFYKGKIYLVKDGGLFSCFDAATGKALYQQERLNAGGGYFSSPSAAHDRIYVCSAQGIVTVLEAGDRFSILAKNDLKEKIYASPAFGDDTILLRTASHVYAFRKK